MGNLFFTANMRNILHSISNIQHTITNFMIRLDTKGNHIEEMTKQISGTVRLEDISIQANDTNNMYSVQNFKYHKIK